MHSDVARMRLALGALVSIVAVAIVTKAILSKRRRARERRHTHVVLNKPFLTLCAWEPDVAKARRKGRSVRSTLLDMELPAGMGLRNVGRLDRDSEGLLLFTSDGHLCHALTAGGHVQKRYWALVRGHPSAAALEQMRQGGLHIRGANTRPANIAVLPYPPTSVELPPHAPTATCDESNSTWLEVELCEGRNRQVRKVTQAAGHKTLRLVRVGIGRLHNSILRLQPGEWTHVEPSDIL